MVTTVTAKTVIFYKAIVTRYSFHKNTTFKFNFLLNLHTNIILKHNNIIIMSICGICIKYKLREVVRRDPSERS